MISWKMRRASSNGGGGGGPGSSLGGTSWMRRTSERSVRSNPSRNGTISSAFSFSNRRHGYSKRPSSNRSDGGAGGSSTTQTQTRTQTQCTTTTMTMAGAPHIVCAVCENLARETCVTSLDMGAPASVLLVAKQLGSSDSGGATYQETMAYLTMLQPHEVLLNEGRRNSPLARKVLQLFESENDNKNDNDDDGIDGGTGAGAVDGGRRDYDVASSRGSGSRSEANQDRRRNFLGSQAGRSQTVVKFISRSFFDQTKGADLLRRVAREDTFDATVSEEYILLSSAYAVLHYAQHTLGATYTRNCLRIHIVSGGNGRMDMDRSTMAQLELLINAKTGRAKNSLFDTIDSTKTSVGSRLLRTNLISPPASVETVETRLALIDEFLNDQDFFYATLEHLDRLPAIDRMLSYVAMVPKTSMGNNCEGSRKRKLGTSGPITPVDETRQAGKGISALICIKTTLAALPVLTEVLSSHLSKLDAEYSQHMRAEDRGQNRTGNATVHTSRESIRVGLGDRSSSNESQDFAHPKHRLLRAIIGSMLDPALEEIMQSITDVFTEGTRYTRNTHAMRHQECFALKSSEGHDMLSVLRTTFLANIDDIYQKADAYAEAYGLHVSVRYTTARGYFLSVPVEAASTLPQIFVQPSKSGKFIFCTTEEVDCLNLRAQDNVRDLLIITYGKTRQILDEARAKYDSLASLSDAIALLDLCHSLADKVTLSSTNNQPWARPHVYEHTPDATLTIRKGRCGIDIGNLGMLASEVGDNGSGGLVANDTYVSKSKPFTIITGVNGSGKSFYIKQIAIIVILAQCGSYIPAEYASVPIIDRICARVGTHDDPENNISSFMMEMRETAYLCNHATEKSLILIDELGRATSNEDGASIAWSVSEYLLSKRCFTFFVTHYPQLCQLSSVYPMVQNQHMKANIAGSNADDRDIKYTYQVHPGPCDLVSDYGIDMAVTCGWPKDVLKMARDIEIKTKAKFPNEGYCHIQVPVGDVSLALEESQRLENLSRNLTSLIQTDISVEDLRLKLNELRNAHIRASSSKPVKMMQQQILEPLEYESESHSHGRQVMRSNSGKGKGLSQASGTIKTRKSDGNSDGSTSSSNSTISSS